MSIRKAPDSRYPERPWLVEVYRDGERTRRRTRTRREAIQIERKAQTAPCLDPRGPEAALLEYLKVIVPRLKKPSDPRSHARVLRPFIDGRGWDDYPEIQRELKKSHTAANLSVATLNRRLALLRRIGRLAVEWGWLSVAPQVRLEAESGRERFLTAEQVEALAEQMPHGGNVVRIAAYTGLRRREILNLTDESILDGGLAVETLKQRKRAVRWVPVPPRLAHLLDEIPFAITDGALRREWEQARAALGLKDLRFHDLRHTYASFVAIKGASDREMSELLGHTDPRMTARYVHFRSAHLKGVVKGL